MFYLAIVLFVCRWRGGVKQQKPHTFVQAPPPHNQPPLQQALLSLLCFSRQPRTNSGELVPEVLMFAPRDYARCWSLVCLGGSATVW